MGPVWPTCSALYTSPSDCLRGAAPAEWRVSGREGSLTVAGKPRSLSQALAGCGAPVEIAVAFGAEDGVDRARHGVAQRARDRHPQAGEHNHKGVRPAAPHHPPSLTRTVRRELLRACMGAQGSRTRDKQCRKGTRLRIPTARGFRPPKTAGPLPAYLRRAVCQWVAAAAVAVTTACVLAASTHTHSEHRMPPRRRELAVVQHGDDDDDVESSASEDDDDVAGEDEDDEEEDEAEEEGAAAAAPGDAARAPAANKIHLSLTGSRKAAAVAKGGCKVRMCWQGTVWGVHINVGCTHARCVVLRQSSLRSHTAHRLHCPPRRVVPWSTRLALWEACTWTAP